MQAEIVTIGDEILIGQIVDTNSAWISEQLSKIGVSIERILAVKDNAREIKEAVASAMERVPLVITTGGLGPTKDDITKLTVAEMFGVNLVMNKEVFDHNKRRMEIRGIDFNRSNQAQALVPESATVLFNENGTAPGLVMHRNGSMLVMLPGVPFEMKALVKEKVIPMLKHEFFLQAIIHKTILLFGIAESVLSELIEDWEDSLPDYLHLAYLPNPRGIRLRLSAYEVDKERADVEIEQQFEKLHPVIEPFYLGYEPISVEGALAGILEKRGKTLAVAESCTGGAISQRITDVPGASQYFLGSIISYSNDVKMRQLGVTKESLIKHGAVSQSVAEQMAVNVRKLMNADYAISTTGVAGPAGGTEEKPVGLVWMAVAWEGGVLSRKMIFGNLRHENIERAATNALNLLRLHLMGIETTLPNGSVL